MNGRTAAFAVWLAAAVPAWTLVADAPDGTEAGRVLAVPGATRVGGVLVEASAEAPPREELEAGDTRRDAGEVSLRLSLPAGPFGAALWSAADGTVAEEEAEGAFEFGLPVSGVWHWLRVRGAGDGADEPAPGARSFWLRAE